MYGSRGLCFHHNLDAWGDTVPVDYAYCGAWPVGGAWLALHFWEHYRFGLDREFLRREAPRAVHRLCPGIGNSRRGRDFRQRLAATARRLPELKIGKHGQLQEWSEDGNEIAPPQA